nr:Ig-like domain-containing protein [Lachnospiraceae bacterium]
MRKLWKIFSYVLVVAVCFALLPATEAKAARGRVALGETKATTKNSFELEIGETIDLNFYGATGYVSKKDSNSVFWKSSNSNIVSVNNKNGVITAVAPGTVTVSMTVTVAATRMSYEGKVEVTVKAKDKVQFKLVAFDKAVLIYPSEEAAMVAAQKGIEVRRVRRYNSGGTTTSRVIPKATIDLENKKIINIEMSFNRGDTYQFFAEGLDATGLETVITWDTVPSYAELRYENAYISEKGGRDITGTKSLTYCDATPVFELYDANDVVIGRAIDGGTFTGASGVSGNLQFVKKYASGNVTMRSVTTGVLRMTKLDQNATIYAIWTSGDKKYTITSNTVEVYPKEYVAPDLGGFVEGIVATNAKGDDINWSNSEMWQGSVPASTTTNILFYFEGDDGKKYSGNAEAYAASDIYQLNTSEYRFVYQLDKESEKLASISNRGRLQTYKEGDIIIYIYQCEPGKSVITANAQIVGQFNVKITEEPEVFDVNIDEYVTTVDYNETSTIIQVKFDVLDQYGEVFNLGVQRANLKVTAAESGYSNPNIIWSSSGTGGTFNINLSGKPRGSYTYKVRFGDI